MQEAQAFYQALSSSTKPKRETVDFDTRRLAGSLAALSPTDSPEVLLGELKELISNKGEATLKHLERMEREAGRDSLGYTSVPSRPNPGAANNPGFTIDEPIEISVGQVKASLIAL